MFLSNDCQCLFGSSGSFVDILLLEFVELRCEGADGPDTLRWDVESAWKLLLRPDSGTRPEMRSVPVEQTLARWRAEQVGPALLVRPLHDGVLIPQARLGVLDQDQLLRCQMAEDPRVAIMTLLVPVTLGLACHLSPASIDRLIGCRQDWQSSLEASPKQHLSWAETVRSWVVAEFS